MQPIKIIIEGNFYDSQIYRGRLYLWHFDGRLSIYDWTQLVAGLQVGTFAAMARDLCLLEGTVLYHSFVYDCLMRDQDVKNLVFHKMLELSSKTYFVSAETLQQYVIKEYDVPTGELPIETQIYYNTLYYTTDKGVFTSKVHQKEPVSATKRPTKFWDCRIHSMSVGYGRIAMSAAEEGLWELDLRHDNYLRGFVEKEPRQITEKFSSFANYAYASIFNSSLQGNSFMLYNDPPKEHGYSKERSSEYISEEEIFGTKTKGLEWGGKDKIYRIEDGILTGIKFNNYYQQNDYREGSRFAKIFDGFMVGKKGRVVVGGGSAYFGAIIEYLDGLTVLQSDGDRLDIHEEVTRWRTFTRSLNYENQLHVVLNDSLCIYAFIHDYGIKQNEKTFGILYSEPDYYTRNGRFLS